MSVFPGGGSMGVAFFFVLGGFAMTIGYNEKVLKVEFNYKDYILRRLVKFYPLHWLCLILCIPLAYETFSLLTFGLNAALLHSWIPKSSYYFSYNMVSWYLADTMFFAVVFPYIFKKIVKFQKKIKLEIGIVLLLVYTVIVLLLPAIHRHYVLYINPIIRLFDFILGIYAGCYYLRLKEKKNIKEIVCCNPKLVNGIVLLSIAFLVLQSTLMDNNTRAIAGLYWPLIIVVVLLSCLLSNRDGGIMQNKWIVKFGEYSFPFFMLHQVMIRYVYKLIRPSLCLLTDNRYVLQVMLIIICFILTLFFSIIIQNYINKPITQWLTKKIQPSMTVQ